MCLLSPRKKVLLVADAKGPDREDKFGETESSDDDSEDLDELRECMRSLWNVRESY